MANALNPANVACSRISRFRFDLRCWARKDTNTKNDIAIVWHLVKWPHNARLHGRPRSCDTPSPTLTHHNGHILIGSLFTMQKERLAPAICAHVQGMCVRMSTWGFHAWAKTAYFGRVQKKLIFFVQNMKPEALLSNRHTSRTMLSKAKHSTPTPSNAARRCAQRARQFVWQFRSHSEADDPLWCSIVSLHF